LDLEREVGSSSRDEEEDEDNGNDVKEPLCYNPYSQCPYHKKKGPPSPPPLPPPPAMGGNCGEGTTQFNMWEHY
jgi:hypothetical protein